jgi:N-acetylglucosamine-6-phosphate deacetylase
MECGSDRNSIGQVKREGNLKICLMLTALTNAKIFTGSEKLTDKTVLINSSRIEAITDAGSIPQVTEVIDCEGNYLTSGLIDLQIAGAGGFLFSANPSAEALKAITSAITESGTTGFLIAMPTNSFDVYRKVIKVLKENPHPAILGLHIEGPYISPLRRGAHIKELIKSPQRKEIEALIAEGKGIVKMLTLAPEMCNSEIVKLLNDNGIIVAAGHSNATYSEAVQGFRWGIKTTTHLFNAMSELRHRDPGLPGAVFETENVFASIIADGIHVDYNMISIAKKLLKERLFLISDAVEENLQESYLHVRQEDRFTLPDGTLSGSMLTMMKAVRNCVNNVGISLEEALRMASVYPARVMNISDKGSIEQGSKADIIVFDKNFEIKYVFIEGRKL